MEVGCGLVGKQPIRFLPHKARCSRITPHAPSPFVVVVAVLPLAAAVGGGGGAGGGGGGGGGGSSSGGGGGGGEVLVLLRGCTGYLCSKMTSRPTWLTVRPANATPTTTRAWVCALIALRNMTRFLLFGSFVGLRFRGKRKGEGRGGEGACGQT